MSEKITFKDLVEQIAEQSRQSHASANSFIHELVGIIESGLKTSGSVSISGFGKFELRWMKERTGTHPQTGEEISIPAQNKVVFKPFKALREEVNEPYSHLKSRLIRGEYEPVPAGFDEEEAEESAKPAPSISGAGKSAFELDEKELPSVEELLIIRDNPYFSGGKSVEKDQHKQTGLPPAVALPDEDKMAREVQKSGEFKWSYAAAVIIALIAFILLFYMLQSTPEPEIAQTPQQTEQPLETPAAPAIESETDAAAEPEPDTGVTEAEQAEFETDTFTVEPGQSLWSIAETSLGNPYLWPLLYHLNSDVMLNPNQLPAASSLEIPRLSDPDNLNTFEREQVALGYFSLYEWNRLNNPDEARYFLWAVGVFSPDLLESPPSQPDPDDLAFARNR